MHRLTEWIIVDDRRHSGSLAGLLAEPSAEFRIVYFLHGEAYARRENLLYPLLGGTLSSMMRYALAKLGQYMRKAQ